MKVELRKARAKDVPALRRLMQLYLYDFAAIDGWTIRADGLYGNDAIIEDYWTDPKRTSFLVYVDGALAGFVLVRDGARFAGVGTRTICLTRPTPCPRRARRPCRRLWESSW